MTSYHMRSPDSNPTCLLTEMASTIVVLSFKTHARGIHLYEVDCCRLRSGSEVILRRQPSRYDLNVVDLLILHSGPAKWICKVYGALGQGSCSFHDPSAIWLHGSYRFGKVSSCCCGLNLMFSGAATGSPYIVFISTSGIYIYIYIYIICIPTRNPIAQ